MDTVAETLDTEINTEIWEEPADPDDLIDYRAVGYFLHGGI
jgi:hypothetical protein|tara:strand:+ start:196 stop:318 length:123 start_codon:yes stop_codon:yes gene_type:complete